MASIPKQSALANNNVKTRAQRSREAGEILQVRPPTSRNNGAPEIDAESMAKSADDWMETFKRYETDIVFIRKGFEKGRFEDAVNDLNELFAIMIFDTKLSGHAVVVAFFKTFPDLTRLHREVAVDGYTPRAAYWWTPYDKGKSLFIFPIEDPTRQMMGRIVTNEAFDNFIMFCIVVGTVLMALSTQKMQGTKTQDIFDFVDIITNFIFTMEMCMRIIWMGFYMSETAYLKDSWFQLDFVIVILGWLSLIDGFPNFKSFRGFRALRAIKGLRFLSYCAAVLESLFAAMPLFADVFSVTLFLMLIFGIMGVQLFKGAFHRRCESLLEPGTGMEPEIYCGNDLYGNTESNDDKYVDSGYTCPRNFECAWGDSPDDGWTSFNNIALSGFTIFQMMTLEGWTGVMYMGQYAESNYLSYYFVIVVLLFGFIVVNLYIAVIVQTFAKIRKQNDKAMRMQLVAEGKLILHEDGTVSEPNPISSAPVELKDMAMAGASQVEQVEEFLKSLQLEQYKDGIFTLVDNLDEIWLLSQEDLASIGMKLVHIRRLMEATKAPAAFHDPLTLASVGTMDPAVPVAKSSAEDQFAFLRAHGLEQYHSKLIKLCDSLEELSKLSQADFEYAGLKLHHARELVMHLEDRRISMPQEGEELLNPQLIRLLGGESVGMWRARIMRSHWFWRTRCGTLLLYWWYRQDPRVDTLDPPEPAARTKFVEPFEWDNPAGRIIASGPWEVFISITIIINIFTMSMNYYKAPDEYRQMLKHFEVIFCFIFSLEMGMKMAGMGGLKWYFSEPFNQFDFILVTTSIPSAVATIMGTAPFINLSMLRVMKMLRMLKLLKKTRQLIMVVAQAAKPIGNLTFFILFTLSISACSGMALFGGLMCEEDFNTEEGCPDDEIPRVKFDTFPQAVYALFQCMTGEDWNAIMFNAMWAQPVFAIVFFCSFFILLNYILMEMFCAVILENFQLRAEERHELQAQLLSVKKAKAEAAKALAEGVDRELARIREEEAKKTEQEEARKRAQKIREQNEAKKLGLNVDEEETDTKKTPEEIAREERLKEQQEQELRERTQAELAAKATTVEVPEAGEGYMEDQAGSANSMILDALDDKPAAKKKKNEVKVVVVEKSCMVFSQENPFREWCFKVVQNPLFDTAMFLTICVSSILLALDTPYKIDPTVKDIIKYGDPTILGIFSLEFCVRVVASGFSGKPSAYIHDPWNRLDFFVLSFSWACVMITDIPGAFARTIRIGRAIRPLRMINQNERIQIVFNALFMAMPDILNVVFLLVFVMFMFAVMGMGFFMGMFWYCNDDNASGLDTCVGHFETENGVQVPAVWANPTYSFDNVFAGILTLYEASSLEGWPDILYSCTDMVGIDEQPSRDNEPYMWWYIVIYICVGPFFVLNLVVGVIIEKFNQISGRGLLTDEQRMFKDTLLQAMLHDDSAPLERPQGTVRGVCYAICQNANFETFILVMVVINSILMATEHWGQPKSWGNMLDAVNLFFVIVFTIESGIKLTGLGPRSYFHDSWNCMDFTIVVGCLLMIPLDGIVNIQVLRPFRLFMLFRMIRRAKGIRLMVCTLLMSLPALFNVTCLLALSFFVYAVLGMSQFANVKFGENLNIFANFRTFDSSLLLLTRMVTGEGWNAIMHDCMVVEPDCTNFFGIATNGHGDTSNYEAYTYAATWFAYNYNVNTGLAMSLDFSSSNTTIETPELLYYLPGDCGGQISPLLFFVTFQVVGNYMVINLFVAVILDNYAFMANVGDAEISEFVLTKFRKTWYGMTLKDKHVHRHLGKYLRLAQLREFMSRLGAPLGVVLWDKNGMGKYKQVQQECRRHQTPGLGVSYRKMQYILCLHAMGADPACDMPLDEKVARDEELQEIRKTRAAHMLQAAYYGHKGRSELGVTKGPAKSEAELQALSFKSKFSEMMRNPQKQLTAPALVVPSQGSPPSNSPPASNALATAVAVPPMAVVPSASAPAAPSTSPGVQPNGAQVTAAQADETAKVKNVFRERAMQRAAAAKGKK